MPPPTAADRALLRAIAAFGGEPDILSALSAGWRSRLDTPWSAKLLLSQDPQSSRDRLLAGVTAEKRPSPDRVHPTWWARAIRGESPAVQRVVLEHFSPSKETASRDLPVLAHGGRGTVDPGALRIVLDLWSERLVGGEEPGEDDPAVIRSITGPGPALMRQLRAAGVAKLAYAEAASRRTSLVHSLRLRPGAMLLHALILERLRGGPLNSLLAKAAARDADESRRAPSGPRSPLARLGGIGLARLMTSVEPVRARWALQHLPYHLVKEIRARMPSSPSAELMAWEEGLWRLAAECLDARRDFEVGDDQ
jgi:hypothetical protein